MGKIGPTYFQLPPFFVFAQVGLQLHTLSCPSTLPKGTTHMPHILSKIIKKHAPKQYQEITSELFISFFFLDKKGWRERPIVTILPVRDHSNSQPAGRRSGRA